MDKLNQIGKYIGKTQNNADDALKRYSANIPKVERVRDVFDRVIPFTMTFMTEDYHHGVSLDLFFRPPPPSACCEDCFCVVCETFDGNNESVDPIILTYGYIQDAIHVFINSAKTNNFIQTDPAAGIITLTNPALPYAAYFPEIKVCYIYYNGENCTS